METTAQEATAAEESALNNEPENARLQQDLPEVPELNFNLERKNSHGEDMPSLDIPHVPAEMSNEPNEVAAEELIQNTADVPDTVELIEKTEDTNIIENTEIPNTELIATEIPELTKIPEALHVELTNPEISSTDAADAAEIRSSEAVENPQPSEIQEQPETVPEVETNTIDLEEIKPRPDLEEFPENNTECQLTLDGVVDAEGAVAQLITPDEPQIENEIETHILVENDLDFPTDQAVDGTDTLEVPNSVEESSLSNVEYGVILNDNQTDGISINGVHEITKQEMGLQDGLYEPQVKVDQDSSFNSDTMGDMVTIASEVQHADGTIITLPSDTVTEVTFSNVEMLDSHEGVVTLNQLTEQAQQEVVLLPEDEMVLMEEEEYDQPESIEVNVLEADKSNEDEEFLEEEELDSEGKLKSGKGRSKIPCHVLGRSIDNPLVDPVRNGRVLLKPRLGVKIPYRNLTSQIVTKQEIAEEIMERSRLRQSAAEPPAGGDVFFAKKLTQRLAKKLVPSSKTPKSPSRTTASTSASASNKKGTDETKSSPKASSRSEITVATVKVIEIPQSITKINSLDKPSKILDTSDKIIDNSDLIALLEGDDVPDWNIGMKSDVGPSAPAKTEGKRSADWEREIALKQLKELPKQTRSSAKSSSNKYVSSSPPYVNREPPQEPKEAKEIPAKEPVEEEKDDLNIEPRFSSNTVVKTYTRKRKPFFEEPKPAPAQPKKAAASEEKPPVQKQPPVLSPLKPSSPSVHKHPPLLSAQKSPKASTAPTVQKSAATPKSSTVQKSSNVQKPSSSATAQKPPAKTPPSAKKPPEEKKEKQAQEKKPLVQEKRRPSTPTEAETPTPSSEPTKTLSPNTYISKSSRIVKRKKIWDPDEATPASKLALKSPKPAESPDKPAPLEKKPKPVAVLKPSNEKLPPKPEKPETPKPRLGRPLAALKLANEKPVLKKMKKLIAKKKRLKRLTEVDRLLMDEGAVNLLYSVKNTEEIQNVKKKKMKTRISLDRAQRELQNKTNEIRNDLQINSTKDSPISLRKKEGGTPKSSPQKDLAATVLHRKKSKDSMSGSVHSPPASPGFAYSQHANASRIIRRHSSSSFSSEHSGGGDDEDRVAEKKVKAEPQKKKAKLNHEKPPRGSIGVDKQLLNEEMTKNFNRPPSDDPKYSEFKTFSVRKFENLTQIILASTSANGQTTLSVQVLSELAQVLGDLQKDDSCRVVVLSSSGSSFCEGIDYKELACDDKAARQSVAEQFALSVREFLMALSQFSKLLVAGVHGNTVGLGVTMLPLFDMVLASDTATFSTPYARLGCAAEGGVLLTLPHVMHNALASELFFASRKLTAAEALRLGLVTRTLWPDKFQEELISALKLIAGQSLQSMQAIKKQLRHHLLLNVEASLKSESSILIEHWTSDECQSNFGNYNLENK